MVTKPKHWQQWNKEEIKAIIYSKTEWMGMMSDVWTKSGQNKGFFYVVCIRDSKIQRDSPAHFPENSAPADLSAFV